MDKCTFEKQNICLFDLLYTRKAIDTLSVYA